MYLKRLLQGSTLAIGILVSGCAGPGEMVKIPVTTSEGTATIVAHNQKVPSWLLATDQLEFNYVYKGDLDATALSDVGNVQGACRIYTKTVRPNELVAVVLNGVVYGGIGFPFGGLASMASKGADFVQYGQYNGTSYTGGGVANAVIQMGGKVYTFQSCGQQVFALFNKYKDSLRIIQDAPY